ncbi:protein-L-isoaspartate O-methyltransferase [Acidocella sp.]|uniref:protein-L-isoaspartate O-methyltransferase family protein n=1 Tax=Acidocella sp. TaxID=50710 RepID=UPI00261BE8BF|nr:protein-L-isoaspartate O-methyltransferase [Acidocella sp.]
MVRHFQTFSRRGVIAGLGAALAAPALADQAIPPLTLPTPATPNGKPWTLAAFETAMAASGRPVSLTQAQFDAIQARKPAAMAAISDYLTQRLGKADPLVMAAFEAVPREYYHYNYEQHRTTCGDAYDPPPPKTWALGYGSVLSDYEGQAYMTQVIAPKPGEVSLEIGTGSGFQSSVLSRIVDHAYTIEIIAPIGNAVQKIFAPLGYTNITAKVGDGFYGWPEVPGGFDIIIVTCVAQYAPPALFAQLKPGGRMIIPIGQPFKHGQVFYVYHKDAAGKIHSRRDIGCFFIPMTGAMQTAPTGAATSA